MPSALQKAARLQRKLQEHRQKKRDKLGTTTSSTNDDEDHQKKKESTHSSSLPAALDTPTNSNTMAKSSSANNKRKRGGSSAAAAVAAKATKTTHDDDDDTAPVDPPSDKAPTAKPAAAAATVLPEVQQAVAQAVVEATVEDVVEPSVVEAAVTEAKGKPRKKRGVSAYDLFRKDHPGVPNRSELWKSCPDRASYEERAKALRQQDKGTETVTPKKRAVSGYDLFRREYPGSGAESRTAWKSHPDRQKYEDQAAAMRPQKASTPSKRRAVSGYDLFRRDYPGGENRLLWKNHPERTKYIAQAKQLAAEQGLPEPNDEDSSEPARQLLALSAEDSNRKQEASKKRGVSAYDLFRRDHAGVKNRHELWKDHPDREKYEQQAKEMRDADQSPKPKTPSATRAVSGYDLFRRDHPGIENRALWKNHPDRLSYETKAATMRNGKVRTKPVTPRAISGYNLFCRDHTKSERHLWKDLPNKQEYEERARQMRAAAAAQAVVGGSDGGVDGEAVQVSIDDVAADDEEVKEEAI